VVLDALELGPTPISSSFRLLPDFAQLLERDRLDLAGVFSAAASLTTSDFEAERVLRLDAGFASDCGSTSAETGAGVATEATSAVDFRPSPSALAIVERCCE
jgi:hypothetical protein